jgi:hypothetical protein
VLGDAPDPGEVYFDRIVFGGSGCPAESVAGTIAPDGQQFTLLFDSFIASDGPDALPTDTRKSCIIDLRLHVPAGWSYQVLAVDYRGYAQLGDHSEAILTSKLRFPGGQSFATSRSQLLGPRDDDYLASAAVDADSQLWSGCDGTYRDLRLETAIFANAAEAEEALITVDSLDGSVAQTYHIQWKRCLRSTGPETPDGSQQPSSGPKPVDLDGPALTGDGAARRHVGCGSGTAAGLAPLALLPALRRRRRPRA